MTPSTYRPSLLACLALDVFYLVFAVVASPVLVILLLTRRKWREGFRERMGFVPRLPPHGQRIWVHAISVGESEAARPLVAALRRRFPDADVVLSTTTRTGRARARKLLPGMTVFHYPLDFPWAVSRTLRRIGPALIVQVEAEWWPCFLLKAARRGIPVCMTNVRITEKAVRGYRRIGWLFRRMVNAARIVAVQNEAYADRLRSLGAHPGRVVVTGQMKYDNVTFDAVPGAEALARDLGLAAGEPVVVAGSTGPGEEEMLLAAYARVKATVPGLRLAIVPRKPERFDEVARLIAGQGFHLVRRSETTGAPAAADPEAVILGDTMGELMAFYQLGTVALVGRSLVPMGGSNPIDPASLGLPLVFGPHMFNFPEADELFVRSGAARVVDSVDSLAQTLAELLQSGDALRAMGERGRKAVRTRQGATARNVDLIARVITGTERPS